MPTSCTLILSVLVVAALSYPANPGPYDLPLPDGSALRVWARGDEFTGPRYVDAQGRHVHLHPDGTPSYYDPTGLPGAPLRSRRQALEQAKYSPTTMPGSWEVAPRQRRAAFNEALAEIAPKRSKLPRTEPLVFVLVQYRDWAMGAGMKEHILRSVFNASSSDGDTINSYYAVQSNNKFQFTQARETWGDNDGVIGPITVDCPWTNQTDWSTDPDYTCLQNSSLMGAAQYLDLRSFDTNNDGVVSGAELHIVVVVAGGDMGSSRPGGMSNCPHVWGFACFDCIQVRAQNVTFGEHVFIGEKWGFYCNITFGIGVVAHELGHKLGLPDLYDMDSGKSILGPWCLMDIGLWNNRGFNPSMMSPFCREYLVSIALTDFKELSHSPTITLPPSSMDPDAVRALSCDGVGEYFLVENRQRVGCDKYLRASGVIVWHVNEAAQFSDSNHASAVALIERIQRRNLAVLASHNYTEDFLTTSARQSMYCESGRVLNSLLDNFSSSCVSLSASVDPATLTALEEPWTDADCASCVIGKGGIPVPTQQYSIFEQSGFSLVSMVNLTALKFTDGFSNVLLPWPFTFDAVQYPKALVSERVPP
eukprot:m51a1_g916 hypothetical protein (591) ;mRNA; r:147987-150065